MRSAKREGAWLLMGLCAALLLASWLRLPRLEVRPMHGDEAVHAAKMGEMQSGDYAYDPREYHGPTLYFFAWPLAQIAGETSFARLSENTLRGTTALFGLALIPLLWLLRDGFASSRWWLVWAALFTSASPLFVFYARYYIQETLLVFWSAWFFACLWRAQKSAKPRAWIVAASVGAGIMLATKETAVIALACVALAALVAKWRFSLRQVLAGAAIAAFTCALLFSNFGRQTRGALDALGAASTYASRAGGSESQGALHQHPFAKYFEWLLWFSPQRGPRWSEWLIALLCVVGIVVLARREKETDALQAPVQVLASRQQPSLGHFLAAYTLAMALIYSLIPYKTPWCAMGFWHGAILLAGVGAERMARGPIWRRALASTFLLAGVWNLTVQSRLSNERFFADARNPWAYAHPTNDVKRWGEQVQTLALLHPRKNAMRVVVIAPDDDYWPLPFYARTLSQIGFFRQPPDIEALQPAIIVASRDVAEDLAPRLAAEYHAEFLGLRRGVVMSVFIEKSLWERYGRFQDEVTNSEPRGEGNS